MKCQQCGKQLRGGARFCPFCGTEQAGLANVVGSGATSLSCPGCGADNLANARFCQDCGRQLPHAFGLAAEAAGHAQKAATSSSGRQPEIAGGYLAERAVELVARANAVPADDLRSALADLNANTADDASRRRWPMTPAERTAFIRKLDSAAAERAALDVPAPTGRGRDADLAAAGDHLLEMDTLWQRFDQELRDAQAEAGRIPSAQDAATLADLQRRADIAWASRERARHHRDALEEPDRWQAPPGDGGW